MDQDRGWHGDLELVREARSGQPRAVEVFVQRMRCIPRFLAARNRRAGRPLSEEDLADAAQQVFALVWSKADEFRGAARLETWVHPFCSLTFSNILRARGNQVGRLDVTEHVLEAPPPARGLGEHLDDAVLLLALERIDAKYARVIRLKLFGERTFEEIAEVLEIPANTARSWHYRGLVEMRAHVRSLGPEAGR